MLRITVILGVLFLVLGQISFCQDFTFHCELKPEKNEYLVGEPVWISVCLYNNSSDVIYISRYQLKASMVVKDHHGNQYKLTSFIDFLYFPTLYPGDSLSFFRNIDMDYGTRYNAGNFSVFPPGQYTVTCQKNMINDPMLLPGEFKQLAIRSFEITSNQIGFRVVEPEGDEAEAFRLYNRFRGREEKSKRLDYAVRLIEEYPNSAYIECAHICVLSLCDTKDYEELFWKYNWQLLNKYPDSHFVEDAVTNREQFFRNNRDSQGARAFFEEIILDHPATEVAKEAQWRLNRLDKLTVDQWINLHKLTRKQKEELGLEKAH